MVMHVTSTILLVGLFAINTRQCPPPRPPGCSGDCALDTTTSSPVTCGCKSDTTTTSSNNGCPTTNSQTPGSQTTGSGCNSGTGPSPGNGAGCDSCTYPNICTNIQASSDVPANSDAPYYDQVVSSSLYVPGLDNACTSLCPLGSNSSTLLLIHSEVFEDGSYRIDIKSIYGFTGSTGVFRGQSLMGTTTGCSTCVYNDFILGGPKGECGGNYVFYRCYLFGDCVDTYKGTDAMTAYSINNLYNISDRCKDVLITFMKSKHLNSPEFVKMPNTLRHQCVTNVGGLECYGANTIEPGTGLSLP